MRTHTRRKKNAEKHGVLIRKKTCSYVRQMCPNRANMHTVTVPVLALLQSVRSLQIYHAAQTATQFLIQDAESGTPHFYKHI